ncbi:hypothetical protein GC170_07410 [bacterium]|nr:hypothetical protein [bacterium]
MFIRKLRISLRGAAFVVLFLALVFAVFERNARIARIRAAADRYRAAVDRAEWSRAMQAKGYLSKPDVEREAKALAEAAQSLDASF